MHDTIKLIDLLDSVLGNHIPSTKHNIAYHCPFCNHHKPKLIINVDVLQYNCFVCGAGGKNLFTLFKKLHVPKDKITRLRDIINTTTGYSASELNTNTGDILTLPAGTKPLWIPPNTLSPEYKNALKYLLSRRISPADIIRYKIMYCDEGQYAGKIIVPSYDMTGKLNYFVSRGYYESDTRKHKNPAISKDVIGFELYVNWSEPIVLVEGVFDAIAIRRNAIPLFGKFISDALKLKIINSGVTDIYICLDNDALKQSLDATADFLAAGINVYFVELDGKDPSVIGFNKMLRILKSAMPITESELFSKQLLLKIK